MHSEFTVHILDSAGIDKAQEIAVAFDELLTKLNSLCKRGREFSIVKTKLEEAAFFAKKSMAVAYPATGSGCDGAMCPPEKPYTGNPDALLG